jgi:hypothetical protein
MPMTTKNFATLPDAKQVAIEDMPINSKAGTLPLCEITWLQPIYGYRPGEKCVTELTCANIIKRNGIRCALRLIPAKDAVKPTFVCAIRGQCNKIIWTRCNEPPIEELCRPPRPPKIEPAPLEAVVEPEPNEPPKRTYQRKRKVEDEG